MSARAPVWVQRVVGGVLLLLPEPFRRRHGAELELQLAEQVEGQPAGRRLVRVLAFVVDAAGCAIRLRCTPRRRHHPAQRSIIPAQEMNFMGRWWRDLLFAIRALRHRPGFTAIAVATLAIGIGANALVFSAVNGVLLRPLPFAAGERMGILWHEFGEGAQNLPAVHPADVVDYRDRSELFETFTMATGREWILGIEDPELVDVAIAEVGFLSFFGAEAQVGRLPSPQDGALGAPPVAVLSHRLWVRRFNADPAIVGQPIDLDGRRVEVIGVLPDRFRLLLPAETFLLRDAEVFTPLRLDLTQFPPRNFTGFTAFGRLRPGVGFDAAQAEVEAMAARLREEHPVHAASSLRARVEPLHRDVVKGAQSTLVLLLAAVAFVLLIACANVANLVLVRGHARSGELALRNALGADRLSLVRLVLLESAVLATVGAAIGLGLASWGLELLRVVADDALPLVDAVTLDTRVLAFSAALVGVSTALFGLLPALMVTARPPAPSLTTGARGSAGQDSRRVRNLLVVAELAASVVLLVGAGLMIRSIDALGRVEPGFAIDGALTFRLNLPATRFPDLAAREALRQELFEELRSLPGVTAVASTSALPLTGSGPLQPFAWNEETARNWESVTADQRYIDPGYFEVMGATLLSGRTFTGDPSTDARTIVIDDRLAALAFAGRTPVGQLLQLEPNEAPEEERYARVIGVVSHLRLYDLAAPTQPQIWFPSWGPSRFSVVVRTTGDSEALIPAVRERVARLAPGAPIEDVRTLADLAGASLAPVRLTLGLMTIFGLVALLLAAIGVYGVIAYGVAQRRRELSIRLALGERPGRLQRLVLVQGMTLAGWALALGLAASALLSGVAERFVYGVHPLDPATYAAAAVTLLAAALAACWIPARRVTRTDAAVILREG